MDFSDRCVVVGSGATAVSACYQLIKAGIKPVVIDSSNLNRDDIEPGNPILGKWKSFNGSFETYKQVHDFGVKYEDEVSIRPSFTKGGFTRVWGATLELDEQEFEDSPVLEDVRKLLRWNNFANLEVNLRGKLNDFIFRFNRINEDYEARRSHLAINVNGEGEKCRNSLQCFDKCPNNAIWFAGDIIESWSREGKIDYFNGILIEKFSQDSKINLHVRDRLNDKYVLHAQSLFLACGPISTAVILIRSGISDRLLIQDSHTIFSGFFSFRTLRDTHRQNALSKWWVRKTKNPVVAMQIHEPSALHIDKLIARLPKVIRNGKLARFLSNYIHPVVIYFEPDMSGRIIVEKLEKPKGNLSDYRCDILVRTELREESERSIRSSLKKIQILFLKHGMYLPIFLTKIGVPGDGFHSGAFLKRGIDISETGEIVGFKDIFVVDASSMRQLRVGSFTPTLMVHAGEIARHYAKTKKFMSEESSK